MLDQLFSEQAAWFGVPALIGSSVFVLRVVFMLIGGGDVDHGGADFSDADFGDVDFDTGDSDLAHIDDSGHAFTWLSVQSIAAFFMGFGWGGLGAYRGAGWGLGTSSVVAALAGAGMVWLLALLLKAIHDLQSTGTLTIDRAVGATGEVYATVPEHDTGRGQVRVVIDNRQRIYDATTAGESLPTNARVRVVAVNDDNTLNVVPA